MDGREESTARLGRGERAQRDAERRRLAERDAHGRRRAERPVSHRAIMCHSTPPCVLVMPCGGVPRGLTSRENTPFFDFHVFSCLSTCFYMFGHFLNIYAYL